MLETSLTILQRASLTSNWICRPILVCMRMQNAKKGNVVMPWKSFEDETSCIIEGRAIVTPEGGAPVEISKGNLVTIPSSMARVWNIIEPIRKRYRIGSATIK